MALLLVTWTFPVMDWTYGPGDDSSLVWVFNSLADSGYRQAAQFIFPHGPLAWLMYPLPEHAVVAMVLYALLKVSLFVGLGMAIAAEKAWQRMILAFVMAFLLVMHSRLEFMLVTNVLVYCWLGLRRNVRWPLYCVVLLVALAFYIKATASVMTLVLFAACIGCRAVRFGQWKHALISFAELAAALVFLSLLLFGTLDGFGKRLLGLVQLASDSSAAVAVYPFVPWGILAMVFFISLVVLFGNKAPNGRYFAVMCAPLLFASWKHGMARADHQHVQGFIIILGTVLLLAVLFSSRRWWLRLPLALLALLLFFRVDDQTFHPDSVQGPFSGFARAALFVSDLQGVKSACEARSRGNIAMDKLPADMRKRIGNATVDVYPYDLAIIPANGLNWQPRPVIQSYVAYTPWLDARDAAHFASAKAPEFIVWHFTNADLGLNGTGMGSIDGRLMLNNEPSTMLQLLSRYERVEREGRFMLLKKRAPESARSSSVPGMRKAAWNSWLAVPEDGPGLLRLSVHIPTSFAMRAKRFFYKDEQVWILMKNASGRIFQYRIVPKNAEEGLWVSPVVADPGACTDIDQVMFTSSGPTLMPDSLDLTWERVQWEDAAVPLFCTGTDTVPWSSTFPMGTPADAWVTPGSNTVDGELVRQTGTYSPTYIIALDSLPGWVGRLAFSYWVKVPGYRYGRTVSSVWDLGGPAGRLSWNAQVIDEVLVDAGTWAHVQHVTGLPTDRSGARATAYVYDPQNEPIQLKGLSVIWLPPLSR